MPYVTGGWVRAAAFNSILAICVFLALQRGNFILGTAPDAWFLRWPLLGKINRSHLIAYIPAIIVGVGSFLLACAGNALMPDETVRKGVIPLQHIAWVFWIPVVEELVYRVAIGSLFRNVGGVFFGGYVSAMVFAFVHTMPTYDKLIAGQVGIPIGPFVLGICCESLLIVSDRVGPSIALHMACNATVPIFLWLDSRWLNWFEILYS